MTICKLTKLCACNSKTKTLSASRVSFIQCWRELVWRSKSSRNVWCTTSRMNKKCKSSESFSSRMKKENSSQAKKNMAKTWKELNASWFISNSTKFQCHISECWRRRISWDSSCKRRWALLLKFWEISCLSRRVLSQRTWMQQQRGSVSNKTQNTWKWSRNTQRLYKRSNLDKNEI